VPGFQLTLIAYSTVGGRKPIVLGNVQVDSRGRFSFTRPVDDLEPGQYVLRAWSASSVAAEMWTPILGQGAHECRDLLLNDRHVQVMWPA